MWERLMRGVFSIFCLIFAVPLTAQAEPITDFRLPNGLEVVVIEDHRAPVVTHMVWYRIGSADEAPGKSGIAHFLEHLMFKGTDDVAPGAFSEIVSAQGGSDNAFTSWDYTGYFQRIAADRLDLVMRLESDRMRDLILTDETVVTERQVILEERSQRVDSDPGALMQEQARAALFQNHRYGIPIIGWRHEMAALTRDDALTWYRDYYAPNNAVLVVAGDVTPDQVRKLAEEYYGPLAPSDAIKQRLRPTEPPQRAERRLTFADGRVSEPTLSRQYLVPARAAGAQAQAAALIYLAELLGGNPTTSALALGMQFQDATAVYSSAYYDATALDYGTFGLSVVPVPGVSLQQAEDRMDAVISQFLVDGVDDAAFARIKTQLRASQIYARDNTDGVARRYGEALTSGLTLADVRAWPDVLQAVTPDDVMAAAKLLDRKQSVTAWLMPAPVGVTE
jgi:zinc protease